MLGVHSEELERGPRQTVPRPSTILVHRADRLTWGQGTPGRSHYKDLKGQARKGGTYLRSVQ